MLLYITVHLISNAGHSKHFTPVLWLTVWAPCRAEMSSRSLSWNLKSAAGLVPPTCETSFPFSDHNLPWQLHSSKQWICQQTGKMLLRGGDDFWRSWMWTTDLLPWGEKNKLTCKLQCKPHPSSWTSLNNFFKQAKFYKIIKFFSRQAEKRQRGVLHTQRCIHTHTLLLVTESVLILHCMRVHKSILRPNNAVTVCQEQD